MPNRRIARTAALSIFAISNVLSSSDALLSRPIAFTGRKPLNLLQMAVGKSGAKIMTSEEEFESMALSEASTKPVMVFFTAPWCGPCRMQNSVAKEVIKEYAGQISSVECCTDDFPEVALNAGVVSIPTIQLYYKGEVQDTIVGCVAKKVLSMAVEKVLEDIADDEQAALNGDS